MSASQLTRVPPQRCLARCAPSQIGCVRPTTRATRAGSRTSTPRSTDEWRVRMHLDSLLTLEAPPTDIELGGHDRQILKWLAGRNIPIIGTITSLLHGARAVQPVEVAGAAS